MKYASFGTEGDVEGDVHSDDGESPDTTFRHSTKGAAMLRPLEGMLQSPGLPILSGVGQMSPSPFKKSVTGRTSLHETSREAQIVLVTRGGLELPLVESPGQTARLLEVVSEMAADADRDRSLENADRRPRPVRTDQVFDRVRVVVQRCPHPRGDDAA